MSFFKKYNTLVNFVSLLLALIAIFSLFGISKKVEKLKQAMPKAKVYIED
jgi:hypothetical protein